MHFSRVCGDVYYIDESKQQSYLIDITKYLSERPKVTQQQISALFKEENLSALLDN